MKYLSLLAAAFLAVAAAPASAQLTKEAQAVRAFGQELDDASKAPDFVGLAVAVVRDGEIQLMRTYGVREAGGTEKVTPDTVFRLASVSKGFAGVLAAMEAKDGKLQLTDPAAKYAPQFKLRTPADTAKVTLEDILSHRTGLPPYAYDNLLEAGTSPAEILDRYKGVKLSCAPKTCFGYQNTTFNMIATAIEQASGKSYVEELHQRLLNPLGMSSTSFGLAGLKATGNWARPHIRKADAWRPTPVTEPYYKVPAAGGMNASVTDLSKWLIAQMGGRPDVLAPDIVAEVVKPRVSTPSESRRSKYLQLPVTATRYGLGWRTYDYAGTKVVTHSGGVEGFFAQLAYIPDRNTGIVILSNTRGSRAAKIMPTWLDHELGLPKTDWFRLDEIAPTEEPPEGPVAAGENR